MHHNIQIGENWHQVQLGGIMEGNGYVKLVHKKMMMHRN
jgi:hypothetical protein